MIYEDDSKTENDIINSCITKLEKMNKKDSKYNNIIKALNYIKNYGLGVGVALKFLRKNNLHKFFLTI